MYKYSQKSWEKLVKVHPDLRRVAVRAIELTTQDFSVIEGIRSVERQKKLVASGASQTMNSRHITGHAIDVAPHPLSWDWPLFYPIADAFIKACKQEDVPLRWGGCWSMRDLRKHQGSAQKLNEMYTGSFPDGVHFELPREFY